VPNERQERAARAEQMRKEREKADRRQRNVISIAIVAIVVVLIGVAGFAINKTHNENSTSNKYVEPTKLSDSKNFGFDYTAADAGGKAGSNPVTVVLYEDFQCPVCKQFEETNGSFLVDQVKTGKITIQYRPYAFLDEQSSTHYSTRAASAGMCVNDEGGAKAYKKFHDLLYANQPPEGGDGLPNSDLIDYAKQAGVTGIDSCIKSEKFGPWVEKALAKGKKAGVSGTPTVSINGKIITGATGANSVPQVADLQKAITAAS
jgi:protein-disulfide isomerase